MHEKISKRRFFDYVQELLHDSRSIGVILFIATAVSLVVANLSIGNLYTDLINHEYNIFHALHLPHTPVHWINEGLMAVFFFLVGMEIKRETTTGELSSIRQAALPIGAAIGGMLVPALIFLLLNKGTQYLSGWGIPMATDIAFSLGVASMFGKRFPPGLKIFLMALAIIDDLGAILVIAFFYGSAIKSLFLLFALAIVCLLWLMNYRKIKFGWLNILLGLLLWYCVFNSGIHATIAGVLFALMVPADQLKKLEHKLHLPVNFFILPLFALANTAIILNGSMLHQVGGTLGLGIIIGLFLGKPLGIVLICRLLVAIKLAALPQGINWMQITGAGILAGIGFTMSVFIAGLAFGAKDAEDISKIAILLALLLSVAGSMIWMLFVQKGRRNNMEPEETAS